MSAQIFPSDCRYNGETALPDGRSIKVSFPHDSDHGAPWEESDGHGPIRIIRDRSDKLPGERILGGERRHLFAYDFAGAMALAKRDGWGLCDEERAKLEKRLGHAPSAGEIRAAAVEADCDFLSGWINERWSYVVIVVDLLDADGRELASDCLGGVESFGSYASEQAAEMANQLIRADDEERAEAAYWQDRDVLTA